MNRKKIIQLAVVICSFGASGLVLYNGFFKNPRPKTNKPAVTSAAAGLANSTAAHKAAVSADKVLPNGAVLDFDSVLKRPNVRYGELTIPAVDFKTEVGVEENQLILPQPKKPAQPVK